MFSNSICTILRGGRVKSTLLLGSVLLLAVPALAQDEDGDGVTDATDNCTVVANPDQRDTDIDGYGNACDPDFNNDLVVNFADLDDMREAFFSSAALTDLNGDDITNFIDLQIFKQFFFGPPGPGAPDVDGDGVPLAQDRCDESPPGANGLLGGCSAFELAEQPGLLTDGLAEQFDALIERVGNDPVIGFAEDALTEARAQLIGSIDMIDRGQMCDGTVELFNTGSTLGTLQSEVSVVIAEQEQVLTVDRPFTERDCMSADAPPLCDEGADHTEEDSAVASLLIAEDTLGQLTGLVESAALTFEVACADAEDGAVRTGTVIEIEPQRQRLFLEDGTYVGIAEGAEIATDVYPGREVRVVGTGYGQSALVAQSVVPLGVGAPLADFLDYDICAELRFAPFQPFPPINVGPLILHEPAGYQDSSGFYRMEHGMRLAVENIPFCADSFGTFFVRYSVGLTIEYVDRNTDTTKTKVLATELSATDEAVLFPAAIKPLTNATLSVSYLRQSCEVVDLLGNSRAPGNSYFDCSEQEQYASEQLTLRFVDKGGYCNATFDREQFSLEEVSPTTFEPTFVDGKQAILVVPDAGTTLNVVGEGYQVNNGVSTYPSLTRIDEGEQFAVYEQDCVTEPGLYVEEICGTLTASGLRWPRLEGVRNGLPFRYVCRIPPIVRDLVDECPAAPDSFYRLPFLGGSPDWTISQGNNGTFTHNGGQAYAFDFVAPSGFTVRAARGGTVTWVREDQTGNSYYNPGCSNCGANAVQITHQDGTVSQYFHFQTDGVFVTEGQEVRRGAALGRIGNTGYSTGPHVHFQARFPASPTFRVRFRSIESSVILPPFACYIPESGDPLLSDND